MAALKKNQTTTGITTLRLFTAVLKKLNAAVTTVNTSTHQSKEDYNDSIHHNSNDTRQNTNSSKEYQDYKTGEMSRTRQK